MRVLERAKFEEIMEGDNPGTWEGENGFQGLLIITKYLPKSGIEAAQHDIIYSASVQEILDAGLTEEDAIKLRNFNWMIQEDSLACYV
jgi:hypothetical protein